MQDFALRLLLFTLSHDLSNDGLDMINEVCYMFLHVRLLLRAVSEEA